MRLNRETRENLRFWGGALAAVAIAAWAVFTYFYEKPKPPKEETRSQICVGQYADECTKRFGKVDASIGCADPKIWASAYCENTPKVTQGVGQGGNACGYRLDVVACVRK